MVIVGAKGFAKEVLEILNQINYNNDLIAFFDNVNQDVDPLLYEIFPVLKNEKELKNFFGKAENKFTLGIGGPQNRYNLTKLFESWGGTLHSTISPFANIGHFGNTLNYGINLMTGSTITNDITIGKGALINLHCTVGHDSKIGEFVEMSPGVHVSGNCTIGDFCNLGTNATILPKITLGNNVVVGAGSVVTKDIPDNTLVVGIPAKPIKELLPIVLQYAIDK